MEGAAAAATLVAVVALGLSAGALVAEGAVLVPFWRSLDPASFLDWYGRHATLLLRFFGPLEGAGAGLAAAAATLAALDGGEAGRLLGAATLLALGVLAAFPLYFQRVNAGFADRSIATERVAAELRRWSRWHWARTALAVAAFACAAAAPLAARAG
jgi:hypothetical protein